MVIAYGHPVPQRSLCCRPALGCRLKHPIEPFDYLLLSGRRKTPTENQMATKGLPNHVVLCPLTHKQQKLPQHEILGACRSVSDFEKLNRIGEGTYGIVYRARDLKSGEIVALKKIRMEREKEGLPICSVREIGILMKLKHRYTRVCACTTLIYMYMCVYVVPLLLATVTPLTYYIL